MKKILIATTNPSKLDEIRKLLTGIPYELVSVTDVGISEDVEETGATFEENAILKASFYQKLSGLPAIADDGGVEIDELNGAPGVHSRRWAGPENNIIHDQASDDRIIDFTLKKMNGVPPGRRGAQMRTVVALIDQKGKTFTGEGVVRGVISEVADEHRQTGFPFRALFYLPDIKKYYSSAYLSPDELVLYSHRKKALDKLRPHIYNMARKSI